MMSFITIPGGNALVVFVLGLLVGGFVIFKYCLDQFEKPTQLDDSDPWKFVVPRYLTSRRQYLIGFSIYLGLLLLIFVAVSLIGPGPIFQIIKAVSAAATQTEIPASSAVTESTLQSYPTFPILVAFYIVGLNPNLPKALDFEILIRRFAHRMAYIPKNMNLIFNFMRFSEFDLSSEKLEGAWGAVDVRRVTLDIPELKSIAPTFNRTILLYTRAGTLAGDLTWEGSGSLQNDLSMDLFKLYRTQIQNVGVGLQAISARIAELTDLSPADRKRVIQTLQRDLIKNLELLYVVFASAMTAKGMERIADRVNALGFVSPYPPPSGIPWDPILKVLGAATLVLTASCAIAAITFFGIDQQLIPTEIGSILYLLVTILIAHLIALRQAFRVRTQLIGMEKYFANTGVGQVLAYAKIFAICAISSILLYAIAFSPTLISGLLYTSQPGPDVLSKSQIILIYCLMSLFWPIVPGFCGVMTAYTLDRPTDSYMEKAISGLLQGSTMGASAVIVTHLIPSMASGLSAVAGLNTSPGLITSPPWKYLIFIFVLYWGLGFVLGFLLPGAIRRHWRLQESRLPEKISVLRTAVLTYFHDIQQFMEWLNTRNDRLEGKRPVDVLAEETGLQRLIAFVGDTRAKIAPASA